MSTYDMLERLTMLKLSIHNLILVLDDLTPLILTNKEWTTVQELLVALAPCKEATVQLQTPDLNYCEFYKIWTVCVMNTKKIGQYDF